MTVIAVPFDGADLLLEPVEVPDATVPNVGGEGTTTIEGEDVDYSEVTTETPGIIADPQTAMDQVWIGFMTLMVLAALVALARYRLI